MARRGSSKEISVRQEDYIAVLFAGKRSKSSGAADHDAGDVRTSELLIECKATMKPIPANLRKQLEKIAKEAWSEGKAPALALRYYDPTTVLADQDGWVDLVVMRASDCAEAEQMQIVVTGDE